MKQNMGLLSFVVILGIIIAGVYGWVMNLVMIMHSDFSHITGLLVIRIIGIFMAPIGAVLGYIP